MRAADGLRIDLAVAILVLGLAAGTSRAADVSSDADALAGLSARLVPVDLKADVSQLPASERAALIKILEAAKLMDPVFLRQVWAGNEALLLDLPEDGTPLGKARWHAFLQNKGPWSRLADDRPFLPGVGDKPPAGTFYPPDATKQEIETWMKGLAPAAQAVAGGFFTTIRRAPNRGLQAVPYSVEFQPALGRAAALLRDAAVLTRQPTLRLFLEKRALAFLTNDYYDSDVAWMKIDATIEPTIGPYEVYEDGWFSAKAAFEAFVTLRDEGETAKLTKLGDALQDIEDHLPIEPALRNPKLGALAPIRVVNSIFSAGDANHVVQTAAFNLPNDERIARAMGTKRTMLKNVQEAKFAKVLLPIGKVALSPADQKNVSFEAFFTHILMHELMHGLGPHESVNASGQRITVRAALQETYGALEEAKADIGGLFALQYLIDKGVLDRSLERTMYTTFLSSTFRSIRFGLKEAHGKGIALQLCTLLDAGGFEVAKNGTFLVDIVKAKRAVRGLTAEIMAIQAAGDKARAAELLRTRAVIRPEVQTMLDRLTLIPVDIEPRFVTAEMLLGRTPVGPATREDRRIPGAGRDASQRTAHLPGRP
jgi:Peptidase family M49